MARPARRAPKDRMDSMNGAVGTSRWTRRFGFTAIVMTLATIGLGTAYYLGSTAYERREAAANDMRSVASTLAEIRRAVDQSRRFEEGILAQGVESGGMAHEAALDDAVGEVDTIIAATIDPTLRDRAIELRGAIIAYGSQFSETVAALDAIGRDDDNGLRGALRRSGATAEARLAELGATALANLLKTIRQQDQNALVQNGATYDNELAERKAAFEQALAASSLAPEAQSEIVDSMGVVFRNAVMLMEANLALNAARDRLAALSQDVDGDIDALQASIDARQASLQDSIEPSLANPPKDVLAYIVIGLIVTALAMWMLTRALLPPATGAGTVVEAARAGQETSPVTPPAIRAEAAAAAAAASAEGNAVATQNVWVATQEAIHQARVLQGLATAPSAVFEAAPYAVPAYRYEDIEEDIDEDVLELIEVAGPIPFETIAKPANGDWAAVGEDIHQLSERARTAAEDVLAQIGAIQHASDDAVKAIQSFTDAVHRIDSASTSRDPEHTAAA